MSKFYIGPARRLSDADFSRLASKHGIEEAKLRAVKQVEAGRSGFQRTNHVKALYEPHIAYRQTKGNDRKKLAKAGLAYSKWKRNYPRTSFARIDKCSGIAGDEISALSTSWGLGQIMGFNHAACGYSSAVSMVRSFAESEANQLEGMINFIKSNSAMFKALQKGDWAGFARRYNGPGYKKNRYDVKLKNAYKKWAKKVGRPTPRPSNPQPDDHIRRVQELLVGQGYSVTVDGIKGKQTTDAIRIFQNDRGLAADGVAGPKTLAELKLLKTTPYPASDTQSDELKEIVEDAAATDRISTTNVASGIAGVSGVGAVANQASDAMNKVQDLSFTASSIQDTIVSVGPWVILGLIIVGACFYIWKERRRKAREAKAALS